MLALLAKFGSPEMVGQFTLGFAVTAPVIMLTNLALRDLLITDANDEYRFGDYLGLRLLMTMVALLAVAGIVRASGYSRATAAVVLVIGLAKAFEAISDIFYSLLQRHERMDRIATAMMIKGICSLAALGGAVYLLDSLLWGVVGIAATWGLLLVAYDARNGALLLGAAERAWEGAPAHGSRSLRLLRPRWAPGKLARLTRLALPLGLVMALISLNTNIPRYFIEHYLGTYNLGIFAALAYLMVAGNTVVSALGQSATPRLARYYAAGDGRPFRALVLRLVAIGALLGAGGAVVAAVAGRWILSLLYRPEYADYTAVFAWLMVAAGLSYAASLLGYSMSAARYFRVQPPLFVAVSVATLVSCALLIPAYQLVGAALAMLVATVVQLAGSSIVLVHAARAIAPAMAPEAEAKAIP